MTTLAEHSAELYQSGRVPWLVRAFLRQEYGKVDPRLPEWLAVLSDVGASECWHKKCTFKEHLANVYRMLKIWGQGDEVTQTGLFHSAYSNCYVNLAIFPPDTGRPRVQELVGRDAEDLIHLFCVVPRHDLIYTQLLQALPDDRLMVPKDGIVVKHIKTGEPLRISRHTVAQFLVLTMADFPEQLFSWQDDMFENTDGRLEYRGTRRYDVMWPGEMKPGLWHSAVSRMGVLLRSCFDDDVPPDNHADETTPAHHQNGPSSATAAPSCGAIDGTTGGTREGEDAAAGGTCGRTPGGTTDEGTSGGTAGGTSCSVASSAVPIPPIFNHCTVVITEADQLQARDLYWEVVTRRTAPEERDEALTMLTEAVRLNPHVAEPRLLAAQIHMYRGEWDVAAGLAGEALRLLSEWGTCWDKRLSWEIWVAYTRALLRGASLREWPTTPFGMLNLGIVSGPDEPLGDDLRR